MNENSENKEPKTSGLRPPTKIPLKGVSRIPSSSSIKLDGPHHSHSHSKVDGGSAVKKNADMPHLSKYNGSNQNTIDERRSSSNSDSFVGDARRLSEAGVRRSSGNSVVLTEDTDKFIIGNRIWVGGTKPGQIAYIGETNFGNGDWAGIVLDEPIGKNDGSVAGTRYFQCEPKKGIFSRLTNLTSSPLGSIEDSMIQSSFAATKPLGFSTPMTKRSGSTVTATKPAAPKSITQTPISKGNSELKIGDRVIISSGQGSKLGVLKYRGSTQFAPGEWCGIELDDPVGKNNGTVEGIKYFECGDKFGLFTPIAKVSKSPMSVSRMSTNCAIHKTKRSPGSMNGSMISGITTNTAMSSIPTRQPKKISDLDRLKQQLTQMKNENELLRSQVTKAANQADEAEKKLEETLKAQVHRSSETQADSTIIFQNQLDNMKKQIDEEKEKIQNLQFTNEEQNVVNIELQNKNSELLIKIKELEFALDQERKLAKDVEKETMKIFEKEEELCRVKEELDSLKKVIDNNDDELQKSVSSLSSEVVDKESVLNTLRQTMNENSKTHERLLKEANDKLSTTTEQLNKVIQDKDKRLEQNQEMIEQLNEGIKSLSALKNEEHDDIVNKLKNELLKSKDEYKVIIDKKDDDIKKALENHEKVEKELKEELNKLLENKNEEIEQLQKKYTETMCLNTSEKDMVNKLKLELQTVTEALKDLKAKNLVYSKETLEVVLEQQIQSSSIRFDDLQKQFDASLSIKEKQIETINKNVMQVKEELIKSKSCLEMAFNDKIKEKDNEIKSLSEKLSTCTGDFEQLVKDNHNVSIELKSALNLVQDKTVLIADLEKKYIDLETQQGLSKNELEKELTTKLNDINNELLCLKVEKTELEQKHAIYVKDMENKTTNMNDKLKENDILVENLNKSLNELTLSKQNELDSMNKRLVQLEEEREQILKDRNLDLAAKDELINTLSNKMEQVLTEKQNQDLNNANLQTELTNETIKYETTVKELQDKINEMELKMATNHESFKKELELTNNEKELKNSENLSLIEKLKILESSKLNLEEKIASNETLKQDILNLNEMIKEKNTIIEENQKKINQLDLLTHEMEVKLTEREEEIKKLLNDKDEKMKMEKLSLEEKTKVILDEKDKETSILNKKIKDLEDIKVQFEKNLKVNESQDQEINKLNEIMGEKIKTIDDCNSKIVQLNDEVLLNKNEFEAKLQNKEHEIKELLKAEEDKLNDEKEKMKKQTKAMLDEKDEETSILNKKIKDLVDIKVQFEKNLKANESQKQEINKLNEIIEEKIKTIDDYNSKIVQLNNEVLLIKNEFEAKLQNKEHEIKELLKAEEDKLNYEKEQMKTQINVVLDEKDKENLSLLEKISLLENTKASLEKKLEVSETLENMITELNKSIDEKTKIIDDNNSMIEQLNNTITQMKEELNIKLKENEDRMQKFLKIEEEKLEMERKNEIVLNEKDKVILNLKEKLNILENTNLNHEKELESNKTQEHDLTELKRIVEEKTKIIEDGNSKIIELNSLIKQTAEDFDARLKEKTSENDELVKINEEKLNVEKLAFETQIQTRLEEKNAEIEVLKNKLQEIVENNTEKELILKLESVVDELDKEKIRTANLEQLKNSELEKITSEHKTELELLEVSKANLKSDMAKIIEEQEGLNAELTNKIKSISEQLDDEKLQVQKKINELTNECTMLKSTLNDKDREIEQLKAETSQKLITDSNSHELNQLKVLLEKNRSSVSHMEFRIQELTDENHHLNERLEGDSNSLKNNHDVIQEKYKIEKKYEETYSMLKIKENQILVLQTELNTLKLKDMRQSKDNHASAEMDKTEAHLLAEKNEEIKMLNSIILSLHKKLSAVMETDVSEFEVEQNPNNVSKEDYQKLYKTAKNNVKLKDCENFSLKQEVNKLKNDNNILSEFKAKCDSLENDKRKLQKLIVGYESSHPTNVENKNCDTKSETDKILEEKDWQINLLNNIIAGLHSKVSDNKFKIEALEKQILDSGMDQNKKVRLRTTRLYCEYCEIFDSHETEDCPEKPESPKLSKRHRVDHDSPAERPFCVCCDMFGHTAVECDNSLTF